MKWLKPVRPNDTLRVVATVLEVRHTGNKPLGILRWHWQLYTPRFPRVGAR